MQIKSLTSVLNFTTFQVKLLTSGKHGFENSIHTKNTLEKQFINESVV